jgi:hypothetical protein
MERKVCSKCGIEKLVSEFNQRKDSKDGYRNECKQCLKISHHLNYKSLEGSVKDKIKTISQEDEIFNEPNTPNETKLIRDAAKQKVIIERKNDRRQKAKDARENLIHAHPKIKWVEYAMGHHNLTGKKLKDQILALAEQSINCPVCRCKMKYYGGGQAGWISASLDRKQNDNTKEIEDYWIICRLCNTTKLNRSMEEMDVWCLQWQKTRGRYIQS